METITTMNTSDTQAFWQEQIRCFEQSGLDGKRFCRQNSLKYSTFGYWKRKLRSADIHSDNIQFLEIPPDLCRIQQDPADLTESGPSIILTLGALRVEIAPSASAEQIRAVMEEMRI